MCSLKTPLIMRYIPFHGQKLVTVFEVSPNLREKLILYNTVSMIVLFYLRLAYTLNFHQSLVIRYSEFTVLGNPESNSRAFIRANHVGLFGSHHSTYPFKVIRSSQNETATGISFHIRCPIRYPGVCQSVPPEFGQSPQAARFRLVRVHACQ